MKFLLPIFVIFTLPVGYYLVYSFASVVLAAETLDPALYAKWGSPKRGGFFIRQQDQSKFLRAQFDIAFTKPSRLTNSDELQQRLQRMRLLVLLWNLIGLPFVIAYVCTVFL